MTDDNQHPAPPRRTFLSLAIFGIGAIFSAIIGVPVTCYIIDPRHRKGPRSEMKLVDEIKLNDLDLNKPKQGVVRDTRVDGWTLYPNDVIGRVWVIRKGPRPDADLVSAETVKDFNDNAAKKNAFLAVFTTICPHLGCAVNLDNAGAGFACPCHAATFLFDGKRAAAGNPAQRGMDTLAWEIDADDPDFNRIKVTYKRYRANEAKKIPLGGGDDEDPNV